MSKECSVCGHNTESYLIKAKLSKSFQESLKRIFPKSTNRSNAICKSCLEQANITLLSEMSNDINPLTNRGYAVLPIHKRLLSNTSFTGKGVTICMIDSGFSLHPDLTKPVNRIKKTIDITKPRSKKNDFEVSPMAWHGTMTSVVCAGNGFLSDGIFRSLAPDAQLVLIKVADDATNHISGEHIEKAINWAVRNKSLYEIDIINISVSGDYAESYKTNGIDKAIKRAFKKGITVVCAVGNNPNGSVLPPANSPYAISVGGLNDYDSQDEILHQMYHSTYGETIDNFQKPDIIAPAIWIPLPILPETKDKVIAEHLSSALHNGFTRESLSHLSNFMEVPFPQQDIDESQARIWINNEILNRKIITEDYMHGDGTSFAAPIVSSIIAQMKEANHKLSPAQIRTALFKTALVLPNTAVERQGLGRINPFHAVDFVRQRLNDNDWIQSPSIDDAGKNYIIKCRTKEPSVKLVSSHDGWNPKEMTKTNSGSNIWEAFIPIGNHEKIQYKFLIGENNWQHDPINPIRTNDGYGGFNSVIVPN